MPTTLILADDLSDSAVIDLLQGHLRDLSSHSPAESVHALDLDALRSKDVSLWTAWRSGVLLGCGALKELSAIHGEVKSMRTVDAYRRQGVAASLLEHMINEARKRRYETLSLETGSAPVFASARRLYVRYGFLPCAPFADYREDPYSTYMCKDLRSG